jgi:hypothetical protein
MKRSSLTFFIGFLLSGAVFGQTAATSGNGSASAATSTASSISSAVNITGTLTNSIDAKKAKVGDEVILKTTSAIKQNGTVVIEKGARLVGRVTDVQKKAKGSADSSVSLVFDSVVQDGRSLPIKAMISSVISTTAAVSAGDDLWASGSTSSTSSTSTSSAGGGGLLGGVTGTAGGLLNTTTNTIGSVAGTASQTVGGATGLASTTVKGLSITNSTSTSAQGGSTLSMKGRDLQLEKGTRFNLSVTSSTSVESQ